MVKLSEIILAIGVLSVIFIVGLCLGLVAGYAINGHDIFEILNPSHSSTDSILGAWIDTSNFTCRFAPDGSYTYDNGYSSGTGEWSNIGNEHYMLRSLTLDNQPYVSSLKEYVLVKDKLISIDSPYYYLKRY